LHARESQEVEGAGNKVDGSTAGPSSEGRSRETGSGRPQSDRGQVRSGEGEIRDGPDQGETEGHLGIMGSDEPCGDEPGKAG